MRELVVDSFAGGGGASTGIEMALGFGPDIAINHDAEAIAMHRRNHPETYHLVTNVWKVDPYAVAQGRPIGLLWASPDCKHFSKAKGGKPVSKNIRDLAWVIYGWAKTVRPRIIMLENVQEWMDWGPLDEFDMPDKEQKGKTFRRFVSCLRGKGYRVEWRRELVAANYGSPTTRGRLFLIARCDGLPIVWPEGKFAKPIDLAVVAGKKQPWRTAAECIDWSLPCYSIFITKPESQRMRKRDGIKIIRPLAHNTMARIARGVKRYVIETDKPFIVPITHTGDQRVNGLHEPHRTTTCAQRGEHALVQPFITKFNRGSTGSDIRLPVPTVMSAHSDTHPGGAPHMGVVAPIVVSAGIINTRNGEREGQAPRVRDAVEPFPVTTAKGSQGGVAVAFVAQHYGPGAGGQDRSGSAQAPLKTTPCEPRHSVVEVETAGFLGQQNTDMVGHSAREPVSTIVQKGCTQTVVAATMINLRGTAPDQMGPRDIEGPLPTASAGGGHSGVVQAFVQRYFGTDQDPRLDEAMGCQTTRDRTGVVEVRTDIPPLTDEQYERAKRVARFLRKFGCWDGGEIVVTKTGAVIVDIGMRMLVPRELFRAQGFPETYIIDHGITETGEIVRLTKTAQIRLVGNSVCPQVAAALVGANYVMQDVTREAPPVFALTAAE